MDEAEIDRLRRENQKLQREQRKERRENEALQRRYEELKHKNEELKHKNEELKHKVQRATLDEYLWNCHTDLYQNFKLADKSICTTGFTKVDGKFYPMWLRPWSEFADSLRHQKFEVIKGACGNQRLFDERSTTRNIGWNISDNEATCEADVTNFEKLATEAPLRAIFRHLQGQEAIRTEYSFNVLKFSQDNLQITQSSGGTQPADEENLGEDTPNNRVATEQRVKPPRLNPDRFGIRTRPGGEKNLAFIYDYKAAHKVAAEHIKGAVGKAKLFLEVINQVNSNKSIIGDDSKQFKAEEQIAMALTQVFDYMVNHGVAYGYVGAGQSLLLLHFDPADPQTLYCHPCVPSEDVGETSVANWADKMIYTAVAQLSSFLLLSLESNALQGATLDEAVKNAKATLAKWPEPYKDAAHLVPRLDTISRSSSPPQQKKPPSSAAGTDRVLRSQSSCRTPALPRRDNESDEEEGPEGCPPSSRTRLAVAKQKVGPSGSISEQDAEMHSAPTRQYCSQACLLGLKNGWDLDNNCPNVLSHRVAGGVSTRHHINADEFTSLVGKRLCEDPYRDCYALDGWGKKGATGVLFKLELPPYGYTFVAKGTWSHYLKHLQHECRVYERLESLQGWVVPVQLGLVHLDRGYILPGAVWAVHMMLMSWGGEEVGDMNVADMRAQWRRSSREVWAHGVDHWDERGANLLWNDERGRVMIIDFDRAVLRPALEHPRLSAISGTKENHVVDKLKSHSRKRSAPQSPKGVSDVEVEDIKNLVT